jgi:hypothetical protein
LHHSKETRDGKDVGLDKAARRPNKAASAMQDYMAAFNAHMHATMQVRNINMKHP